jgi:hypothetical protein
MPQGLKHLVRCRCTLPQYKHVKNAPLHQFPVFSIIDDNNQVVVKFAQCNNCGIIHKVSEINKSEILPNREHLSSLLSLDEIKTTIPAQLAAIFESNDVDITSWEAARFIIEQKQWGNFILLNVDTAEGIKQGKYVVILGENLFRIDSFISEEN